MRCWKCGKEIEGRLGQKINFREECPFCSADLHCCRQCKFYQPGKPNDCLIPGTDFVSDREKRNLCEEFACGNPAQKRDAPSKEEIEKRLFGE